MPTPDGYPTTSEQVEILAKFAQSNLLKGKDLDDESYSFFVEPVAEYIGEKYVEPGRNGG